MAEEYAEKMARKTDAELHLYVSGRAQYRDDAVLAALDELIRRGQPHPDDALVRPELEAVVQAQAARAAEVRQLAEREAAVEPTPTTADPALYSPTTIVLFSILPMSMMLGGGVLMAMNLFRLRRLRALLGLILFMLVYLMVGTQLLSWAIIHHGLNPFLGSLLFNVPAILAYLLWFWPRYVGTGNYRSRSIFPPIVICFLLMWGLQKSLPYLIKQQPKEVQQQMEQLMKH